MHLSLLLANSSLLNKKFGSLILRKQIMEGHICIVIIVKGLAIQLTNASRYMDIPIGLRIEEREDIS